MEGTLQTLALIGGIAGAISLIVGVSLSRRMQGIIRLQQDEIKALTKKADRQEGEIVELRAQIKFLISDLAHDLIKAMREHV